MRARGLRLVSSGIWGVSEDPGPPLEHGRMKNCKCCIYEVPYTSGVYGRCVYPRARACDSWTPSTRLTWQLDEIEQTKVSLSQDPGHVVAELLFVPACWPCKSMLPAKQGQGVPVLSQRERPACALGDSKIRGADKDQNPQVRTSHRPQNPTNPDHKVLGAWNVRDATDWLS